MELEVVYNVLLLFGWPFLIGLLLFLYSSIKNKGYEEGRSAARRELNVELSSLAPTKKPLPTKTPTPRPSSTKLWAGTSSLQLASNTTTTSPTPTPTSKLRPAVTVAPGQTVKPTPTPTRRSASTPRSTSTLRTTASTNTTFYAADEMSHIWNYLMLGGFALFSICVAVHVCRSRSREVMQNAVVIEHLQNRISKLISDEANAKEELQHAYAEMAKLESKLNAATSLQADAVAKKEAEHRLQQANAKISDIAQQLRESQIRVGKLTEELKKAQTTAMPPKLMLVPPVPAPFPEVGDLHKFYSTHYPTTWNHIKTHALNEYSYLNYYHFIWGNLQINHGDGFVHGELTEEQRALVNYPQPGKYIYVSSLDSPHYHNTSNCYALLRCHPIECNRSCADRYIPCTKCVNQ